MHATAYLSVPQPSIYPERVDDSQGPTTPSVRQNLSAEAVVIGAQAVAHRLRILEDFVSVHCRFVPSITCVPSYIEEFAPID
jgi:hypothetical protein